MDPDAPFRILVAGDFSGRANAGRLAPLAGRRAVLVDRDNIDEVLEAMHPALKVRGIQLEFSEMDDFHPDRLYAAVPLLRQLAEERHKPLAAVPAPAPVSARRPSTSSGGLLDQMMEEEKPPSELPIDDLAAFISRVIAKDLVPREDPRKKEQEARADQLASVAMRAILHHPEFQALEAAWRAVELLVRRLETGEDLKLHLLDATLPELIGDIEGTRKLFADPGKEWALIVGNYSFADAPQDLENLSKLGAIAEQAGAPFLAEATPPSSDPSPEWTQLRHASRARWIGLALPRFLLRLPYGRATTPVESFAFEEMPASAHQEYLWGNPAFACACLLAQSFTQDRWKMRPGTHRTLSGLPLHSYTEDGEAQLKPCAEVLMTEKEADFLLNQGIMPLASLKRQDAALLVRFQSISDPIAALGGRWG